VSDLIGVIPVLMISVFGLMFSVLRSARPVLRYFVTLTAVMLVFGLYLLFMSVFGESHGSSQIFYFFLQIIPCYLYAGIAFLFVCLVWKMLSDRRMDPLSSAVISVVIVFIPYFLLLFSGGCIDCPVSERFIDVFGWTFYVLGMF
jgi:hypothetical protein